MSSLHPALILLLGGLVVPLLRGRVQQAWCVLLPALGLVNMALLDARVTGDVPVVQQLELMGLTLEVMRADRLSMIFGYLFHVAALLAAVYAWHVRDPVQLVAGATYAGSGIGVVFAGDLVTLFVCFELMAVTSVFLIWAGRTPEANAAGLRYLVTHVFSGLLLLAGAAIHLHVTGSIRIGPQNLWAGGAEGLAAWLMLASLAIKAAFPLLHTWVVDAYPVATPSGTVYLACFTTKAAICILARTFAGDGHTPNMVLVIAGTTMTLFPVIFAVIENDLRKVLGYSMINQLGFMVVGVGIGGAYGINGAVAHAFAHVIYKALLFMAMGAVLHRAGTCKASEIGGLYTSMPWTAGFCVIGAASISAFPFTSGFVSKSMVFYGVTHAGAAGMVVVWFCLLFASAGVLHHAGIKIPFHGFFAHDRRMRVERAPLGMRLAMGGAAFLCLLVGCAPGLLYANLPLPVKYEPYTFEHVLTQLQLLCFAALAFVVLIVARRHPPELRSTVLDIDWIWRRGIPRLWNHTAMPLVRGLGHLRDRALQVPGMIRGIIGNRQTRISAILQAWHVSGTVFLVVVLLLLYLAVDLLTR